MGYNPEVYANIRREFEAARLKRIEEAEERALELRARFPEIAEIDNALATAGSRIMQAAISGGDIEKKIAQLKEDNLQIQKARAEFLESHGYPADYSDIKYNCKLCLDTGFDGKKMCSCLKSALVYESMKASGLENLTKTQSFDTFSLDYYKNDPAIFKTMEFILSEAKSFAESFSVGSGESLLLMGGTGLGKTHLSTSISKAVIERGFDVMYEIAQNIFSDLEFEKFHSDGEAKVLGRCLGCDLLVIDDLGAELKSQFAVSCLYNIVNTRLNKGLSTIVSTNLSQKEIKDRYTDRMASRFFGQFRLMLFRGNDIRAQKLKS